MGKPFTGLTSNWTRVTVKAHSRYDGRAQQIVKWNGQQRTLSLDYSSTNPNISALNAAFGGMDNVKIVAADGKKNGVDVYWVVKR